MVPAEDHQPKDIPTKDIDVAQRDAEQNEAEIGDLAGEDILAGGDIEPLQKRRMPPVWRLLMLSGFLAFIFVLGVGLQRQNTSGQRADGQAPDFEFTTFEGETFRLADLKGKGIVLNFWASWCGPCRSEAAMLEAAWRREKENDIVFLGLDYLDQEYAALEYIAEFDITYPNGRDQQSAAYRRFRARGVPETFFIGPDGQIESIAVGVLLSEADLAQRLDAIRPTSN